MVQLTVGTTVGQGGNKREPETRSYWEIVRGDILKDINESIDFWEKGSGQMQDMPKALLSAQKTPNTFILTLKYKNQIWGYMENDPKRPLKQRLKTDPYDKSQDQVLPALKQIKQQVESCTPDSFDGKNMILAQKKAIDSRWRAYASFNNIDETSHSEKDKYYALGSPNLAWCRENANENPDKRKLGLNLITTNPVWH